ncbi:hypothetical protein FOA52_000761 [Chlamydomonas sp. UWO 241]|nr:hypothetical protein FOA52_000761 [Chlamydomonas sp. UWO 241]
MATAQPVAWPEARPAAGPSAEPEPWNGPQALLSLLLLLAVGLLLTPLSPLTLLAAPAVPGAGPGASPVPGPGAGTGPGAVLMASAHADDAAGVYDGGACDAAQQPQQQWLWQWQQHGQQRQQRPILVVGSVNVDITMQVHRLPRQGETTTAASPGSMLAVGGKGANQAVAAARLRAPSAPPATFAAQLGSDAHGDMLSSELAGAGVDVTGCGRVEGYPSGAGYVMLEPDGSVSSVVVGGANTQWPPERVVRVALMVSDACVVLLQREVPEEVNAAIAHAAAAVGVPVMQDVGGEDRPMDDRLLALLPYVTPNESELARLTGMPVASDEEALAAAHALQARGARHVVVTLGKRGALMLEEASGAHSGGGSGGSGGSGSGAVLRQAAYPVPSPIVDTTGAGDAFRAAFAVALSEGRTHMEALRWGCVAGALAATRHDAVPSLPHRFELMGHLDAWEAAGFRGEGGVDGGGGGGHGEGDGGGSGGGDEGGNGGRNGGELGGGNGGHSIGGAAAAAAAAAAGPRTSAAKGGAVPPVAVAGAGAGAGVGADAGAGAAEVQAAPPVVAMAAGASSGAGAGAAGSTAGIAGSTGGGGAAFPLRFASRLNSMAARPELWLGGASGGGGGSSGSSGSRSGSGSGSGSGGSASSGSSGGGGGAGAGAGGCSGDGGGAGAPTDEASGTSGSGSGSGGGSGVGCGSSRSGAGAGPDAAGGTPRVLDLVARQGGVEGLSLVDFNFPQHLLQEGEGGPTQDQVHHALASAGLSTGAVCLRFPASEFHTGAFTAPDESVRQAAVDLAISGCGWARALGASELIVWSAFDGYDYHLQADHLVLWEHVVSSYRALCDACPDLKVSIEWKPTDASSRWSAVPSTGFALLLVQQVNRTNMGLTLDLGHMVMAGENPAASVAMAGAAGALFGLQLGDGYSRVGAEDGLAFGSVNPRAALELVYWLQRVEYNGHVYFDTFPANEDPVREAAYNIRAFKRLWARAEQLGAAGLGDLLSRHDAMGVLELLEGAGAW